MRGLLTVVSGLVWFFITSCNDEPEGDGVVSFQEPKQNQQVWNTTPVSLSIPRDFNGSVDVTANGQLIANFNSEPFQVEWNTRTWADGDYTLVATAIDPDGKQTKAQVTVQVRNTLLTGSVPQQHIPENGRAFILISDNAGKTLAFQELVNNETYTITGPENFDGPTMTVTEVYLVPPRLFQAFSITEVKRGKWALNQAYEPQFVGSIQVQSDVQPNETYFVSTSGDYDFLDSENPAITLSTTTTNSNIFVREVGLENNRYAFLTEMNGGSKFSVPLNSISLPLKKISVPITDPDVISARVQLYGFSQPNQYDEHYPLGYFFRTGSEVRIDYPAEFLYVGSESYYRNRDIRMYAFDPKKLFDFKTLNAQVYVSSKDERVVELATYGDFDIYMISWYFYQEATNSSASWVLIGPSGKSQIIRLPDVPQEISSLVPYIKTRELQFTGVTQVSEFGIAASYDQYLTYVSQHGIAGPYKLGLTWKEQLFTKSGRTAGRLGQSEPKMLVEMLKRVN